MTTANLAAVIEKIRKLRALSTSANVHEAAAAAKAAERLLQEHRLSEAQLEADGRERGEGPVLDGDPMIVWGSTTVAWQSYLLLALEAKYGCEGYMTKANVEETLPSGTVCTKWVWVARTVGRREDVAMVRYLYAWLSTEITRLVLLDGKGKGRSYKDSYCKGAVAGIKEAMREAEQAARAQATSEALVALDDRGKESLKALKRFVPNLRKGSGGAGATMSNAYSAGKAAGKNIGTRSALPTAAGTRQMGGRS